MPLHLPAAPEDDATEIARLRLLELRGAPGATRSVTAANVERLDLAASHYVYTLGLEDVANRQLEAATLTSRRYLVFDGERPVASAEVATDPSGAALRFSHTNEGPFVRATDETMAVAERLPEVERGSYEVRALRIPAIQVMALWLKDEDGDHDLFVPMAPTPRELVAGRKYERADFFAALAEPARVMLASDPSADA